MEYLVADRPPDLESWTWWARRDIAVLLPALLYAFAHLYLVISACNILLLWLYLPMLAGFLVSWVGAKLTKHSFTVNEGLFYCSGQFTHKFNRLWDVLDIIEAFLVRYIPERIQWKYSRWVQRQRSWKSIPWYEYEPFAKGQIRVLRLERCIWPFPSVVRASVQYAVIDTSSKSDHANEYEAMSYRWGSAERTEEILLDGKRFAVTRSTFNLLTARRSVWKDRTLWIDALCVNQFNEGEKATQVRLMDDIYRRASKVIAFPNADWRSRVAGSLIYELYLASVHWAGSEAVYSLDAHNKRWRWQAWEELLQNDYFTHMWVVQEIALGARVELLYGGMYIPWKTFFAVAFRQTHARRQMPTFKEVDAAQRDWIRPLIFHPITVMAMLRPESGVVDNHLTQTKLETILFTTSKFEASDPRDKVFAVLGLAGDEADTSLLAPDYTKSVGQLFENVGRYLFLESKVPSFHMLAFAGVGFSPERKDMASWVPDIGREILTYPFSDVLSNDGRFHAGGDSVPSIREPESIGCIAVKGVICDSILALSDAGPLDIHARRGEHVYRMQFGHYAHVFTGGAVELVQRYDHVWPASKTDRIETLWRTLLADRVSRSSAADPALGNTFPHWRRFNELQSMMFTSNDIRAFKKSSLAEEIFEAIRPSLEDNSVGAYTQNMMEACYGRSFALTKSGRMCLSPPFSQPDDLVFIPLGAQTPYLVREKEMSAGQKVFELVGEAYVHGFMMGEGLRCGCQQTIVLG